MKINVRKARRIEKQLEFLIEDTIKNSHDITIFETSLPDIRDLRIKLINDVQSRLRYIDVRYDIRAKIGEFNQLSGLNDLMTSEASNRAQIELYSSLSNTLTHSGDVESIKSELQSVKVRYESGSGSFGLSDRVSIPLLQPTDLVEFTDMVLILKNESIELADKMLELNISGNIYLDDDVVSLLQSIKLI